MLLAGAERITRKKYCPIVTLVHYEFHMDWPGNDTGPSRSKVVKREMLINFSQDSQNRLLDSKQHSSEYKFRALRLKWTEDVETAVRLRKPSMNVMSQKCYL
jgi:hypothetical protein